PAAVCALSLHDALPISSLSMSSQRRRRAARIFRSWRGILAAPWLAALASARAPASVVAQARPAVPTYAPALAPALAPAQMEAAGDRKSTRLNSSHVAIS